MNLPRINLHQGKTACLVLGGVAGLLGLLLVAKVMSLAWCTARAQGLVRYADVRQDSDPNSLAQHLQDAKKAAVALKQKNLFIKPAPKEHPVKQVEGILGNEVLIGDKWYKAGDNVGEARIVAVKPTEVRIEWDGKETGFSPIAASAAASGPPPAAETPKKETGPAPPKVAAEAPPAVAQPPAAPVEEDPLAWMGVPLPPQVREKMLEQWNKMSEEEKAQAKEKWNNMPEDEKRQAVRAMAGGMR